MVVSGTAMLQLVLTLLFIEQISLRTYILSPARCITNGDSQHQLGPL